MVGLQRHATITDRVVPDAGTSCLVLMYHYIHGDDSAGRVEFRNARQSIPGLTTGEFSAQLDRLLESRVPIDWPTLYAWTRGRASIPSRSFLLTFDDGLADHAQTAAPILERRGLHGVFFVPGAVLESHKLLCAHALHLLLSRLNESEIESELRGMIDGVGEVPDEEALRMYHYESPARARLKYLVTVMLPAGRRNEAIADLFDRHVGSPQRWAEHWYLGWDDLVALRSAGHTIGAHGFSHEPLTRLTPREKREELHRVKALLDDGLGPDIRPISYPFGAYDGDAVIACQQAGFVHGFTTQADTVRPGSDPLALPRVDCAAVNAWLREESACLPG